MITVLVRTTHGAEALAVTLSALVPAVAAGLVGDAVVLADTHDETIDRVADAAGATFVVAQGVPWAAGARAARHEWVLCLDAGDVPQEGWIRVLERFVGLGAAHDGAARLRHRRTGPVRNALDALLRRSTARAGDLIRRHVLLEGGRLRAPVRLRATIERDPIFG